MGVGLLNALSIAKSGLFTNQYLINIHGQNIASANNADYTKKNTTLEATTPISNISPGAIGTGVKITDISRVIDQFLEVQINKNNSDVGNWDIVDKYLQQVESIFNNTETGSLNDSFNDFWNAWLDLSNNPSDSATRMALLEKSETLNDFIHNGYSQLRSIESTVETEIKGTVDQVNTIIKNIADLNQSISSSEIGGNNANDLRDSRDKLVKELSTIIDISYVEEENNQFNIFLNNGTSLVAGIFYNELAAKGDAQTGNLSSIFWTNGKGDEINITDTIRNGELKGLLYTRDELLSDYKERLNNLANSLIQEVNQIHSQGVGLNTFSQVLGTVRAENSDIPFEYSGIASDVTKGNLKLIVFDPQGNPASVTNITIDDNINSLSEFSDEINNKNIANISSAVVDNKLQITADNNYTFGFADDETGILSALGINTFFQGKNYELTNNIDIVATDTASRLYSVSSYDSDKLKGDNYTLTTDGTTVSGITNNSTGDSVDFTIETINSKKVVLFDGIRVDLDDFTANTVTIENATSSSVNDYENMTDHVFRIDFNSGTANISVFDITDNITLSSSDYDTTTYTVGGTNYTSVDITKFGVTATIKDGSYGVLQITPEKTAANYIQNNITDTDYINAGKIQTPHFDDSGASVKIDYIDDMNSADIGNLTNKSYTIIPDGAGHYTITDQDGNSITPDAEASNSVKFDGVTIIFEHNTVSGDKYVVTSGQVIKSESDNRNALDIASLKDTETLSDDTVSMSDYLGNFMTKIGYDRSNALGRIEAVNITKQSLSDQRDSVSGVSLDEEMTKLIQIQHAYTATSKLLTVVDSLIKTLLQSA